jgi:succinate dehydrogenase/fumarate reductase flavoprotein subunit
MLVIAEAVATAAKLRQESRGAHSRVDYEGERDEWGEYNIAVRMAGDGLMAFEKLERSAPPNELMAIAKAEGDDLINMEGPLD